MHAGSAVLAQAEFSSKSRRRGSRLAALVWALDSPQAVGGVEQAVAADRAGMSAFQGLKSLQAARQLN
jgi:hypothetical protein